MERLVMDDVAEAHGSQPADLVARIGDALSTENIAINRYELAPGDQFGFGLHRHLDQEEIFLIQAGTVTFELQDGSVRADAGEVVRFDPGEYQLGRNEGEQRVEALAIGVPGESREIEFLRECPACGERTRQQPEPDDGGLVIRCSVCDVTTDHVAF